MQSVIEQRDDKGISSYRFLSKYIAVFLFSLCQRALYYLRIVKNQILLNILPLSVPLYGFCFSCVPIGIC
jgi:hypothetical protein